MFFFVFPFCFKTEQNLGKAISDPSSSFVLWAAVCCSSASLLPFEETDTPPWLWPLVFPTDNEHTAWGQSHASVSDPGPELGWHLSLQGASGFVLDKMGSDILNVKL